MSEYPVGHIKHDPTLNQIAIRTIHDFPSMRWCVATATAGARNAGDDEVAEWDDLYTPEPE